MYLGIWKEQLQIMFTMNTFIKCGIIIVERFMDTCANPEGGGGQGGPDSLFPEKSQNYRVS